MRVCVLVFVLCMRFKLIYLGNCLKLQLHCEYNAIISNLLATRAYKQINNNYNNNITNSQHLHTHNTIAPIGAWKRNRPLFWGKMMTNRNDRPTKQTKIRVHRKVPITMTLSCYF